MAGAPRRFRRAAAALFAVTLAALIPGPATPRDFATVGRIGVRVVEGRVLVLVPIAGSMQLHLSEPFVLAGRSRLILTIQNARLGIGGSVARRSPGLLSLEITEERGDVVVVADVDRLGDYGLTPTEGGILLWIEPDRRTVVTPAPAGSDEPGMERIRAAAAITAATPDGATNGQGRVSMLALLLLALSAATAGWLVRRVRTAGVPAWAGPALDRSRRWLGVVQAGAAQLDVERPDDGRHETGMEPDPPHTAQRTREAPHGGTRR